MMHVAGACDRFEMWICVCVCRCEPSKVLSLLDANGVFMVNLVGRSNKMREEVVKAVNAVFPLIYESRTEEDINR